MMKLLKAILKKRLEVVNYGHVDELINSDKIVAFINGTVELPLCHKSKIVVETLKYYNQDFTYYNLLENKEISSELLSRYPFLPQVFSRGNLMGGAYSLLEFHQNGLLKHKFD